MKPPEDKPETEADAGSALYAGNADCACAAAHSENSRLPHSARCHDDNEGEEAENRIMFLSPVECLFFELQNHRTTGQPDSGEIPCIGARASAPAAQGVVILMRTKSETALLQHKHMAEPGEMNDEKTLPHQGDTKHDPDIAYGYWEGRKFFIERGLLLLLISASHWGKVIIRQNNKKGRAPVFILSRKCRHYNTRCSEPAELGNYYYSKNTAKFDSCIFHYQNLLRGGII